MFDPAPSLEAKQCAREVAARLQRTYGLQIALADLTWIAARVDEALTRTNDTQLGLLRQVAQALTLGLGEDRGPVPAVLAALVALRDAGITLES